MELLRQLVRAIPDFPKPGILYRDITPVLEDANGLREAVAALAQPFRDETIDRVLGMESRGFIFGAAVALELGAGFVAARKPGKLPYNTVSAKYELEYGTDELEVHTDSIEAGQRVLIVDDLIATGGTAAAAIELVQRSGGDVVGCAFLIALDDLRGSDRLETDRVHCVIHY